MQNQTKEKKASTIQKTPKGKIAFILVALLSLGSYFVLDNYKCILNYLQQSAKTDVSDPKQSAFESEASQAEDKDEIIQTDQGSDEIIEKTDSNTELEIKKTLNDNESDSNLTPEIIRFGPDLVTHALEDLSPYDLFAEGQADPCKYSSQARELLIENLNNYRLYISNTNELIIRFLRNENYNEQLAKLKLVKLPNEISEIVKMMEEHVALSDDTLTSKQIFPVNSTSLEKFIKVIKTNACFQRRSELEAKITKKLKIFTSYIYSSDLQEQFLGTFLTRNPLGNNHD